MRPDLSCSNAVAAKSIAAYVTRDPFQYGMRSLLSCLRFVLQADQVRSVYSLIECVMKHPCNIHIHM